MSNAFGTHAAPPLQAPAEPIQQPLPGMPAPELATSTRVALHGILQRDALCFTTPGGLPCVQALLAQHIEHHPGAHHLLVTHHFAASAEGQADARDLAARLHAGAGAIALGYGIEPDTWHGQPVLRLLHCIGLARHAPPAQTNHTGSH